MYKCQKWHGLLLKEINDIEALDESDLVEVEKTAATKEASRKLAFARGEYT